MNSVSNIKVNNALSTSVYTWQTLDGHFTDTTNKTSVYVDQPGTYIVHQKLQAGCPVYASDTIAIRFDPDCGILLSNKLAFNARLLTDNNVKLKWNAVKDEPVISYTVERSNDGLHYAAVKNTITTQADNYTETDVLQNYRRNVVYYRLAVNINGGGIKYTPSVVIDLKQGSLKNAITVAPNPVFDHMQLQVHSVTAQAVKFEILDAKGSPVIINSKQLEAGNATVNITGFENKPTGVYTLKIIMNNEVQVKRFIVSR
jgi:hypothetical protein